MAFSEACGSFAIGRGPARWSLSFIREPCSEKGPSSRGSLGGVALPSHCVSAQHAPIHARRSALIALHRIDDVLQGLSGLIAADLLDDVAGRRFRLADGGIVRGYRDFGMGPERRVLRQWLGFENVQGGGSERAIIKAGQDVGFGLQAAPSGVDQDWPAELGVACEFSEQARLSIPLVSVVNGTKLTSISVRARNARSLLTGEHRKPSTVSGHAAPAGHVEAHTRVSSPHPARERPRP